MKLINISKNCLNLLRIHQWLKNSFVLAGIFFAHAFYSWQLFTQALWATGAFCLISSASYIYNDIIDLQQDRLHMTKKNRALASQKISIFSAKIITFILIITSLLISYQISVQLVFIIIIYFILNIFYTHIFKKIVIIDVFVIALGFMLRILAGTIGMHIMPSPWILLCGINLTLFLGFAKRRAEYLANASVGNATQERQVLSDYQSIAFIDQLMLITASCSVITYALYTLSPETIHAHHTADLIYTVPLVMYSIFRYLYLCHVSRWYGEDTAKDIFKDKSLLLAILTWILVTIYLG